MSQECTHTCRRFRQAHTTQRAADGISANQRGMGIGEWQGVRSAKHLGLTCIRGDRDRLWRDCDRLVAVAGEEVRIPGIGGRDQMRAAAHRTGCIGHRAGGSSIGARESTRAGDEAAAAVRGPADIPGGGVGTGTAYDGGDTGDARTISNDRGTRAAVHARVGADHGNRVGHRDLHVIYIGNSYCMLFAESATPKLLALISAGVQVVPHRSAVAPYVAATGGPVGHSLQLQLYCCR